jgi:hypothetical protein
MGRHGHVRQSLGEGGGHPSHKRRTSAKFMLARYNSNMLHKLAFILF